MDISQPRTFRTEAQRIFVHARWPVQSYVLLGFLLAAVLTRTTIDLPYVLAFVSWLLIVVGLTVLNSYYDKDEAPVGGMQNPPKVNETLLYGALALLAVGLLMAVPFGATFFLLEFLVVFIYFFYSYEGTRWKENGYMAVSINAIVGSLTFLGAAALAGPNWFTPEVAVAGVCAAAFKASVYAMMQVHQIKEDTERGDRSLAVMHGREFTLRFSQITMLIAGITAVIATLIISGIHEIMPVLTVLTALYFVVGLGLFEWWLRQAPGVEADAARMQRMIAYTGYFGSVAFAIVYVVFMMVGLV